MFDTPHLITSLSKFAEAQQDLEAGSVTEKTPILHQSVLFLHVNATADFFTTNQTLMRSPPPVDVDIILDPYLFNIVPKSLAPTGVYITVLAIAAWFISGAIWKPIFSTLGQKQHSD